MRFPKILVLHRQYLWYATMCYVPVQCICMCVYMLCCCVTQALVTVDASPTSLKPGDIAEPLPTSVTLNSLSMPPPSQPLGGSTPVRARKSTPVMGAPPARLENDNESTGGHSDMLDFDSWSETASNGGRQLVCWCGVLNILIMRIIKLHLLATLIQT